MKTAILTAGFAQGTAFARKRADRWFIHATLFSTLFLQKFGIVSGRRFFVFALPLCIVLFAWAVISGRTRIDRRALVLYSLFICSAFFSAVLALMVPGGTINFSLPSLILLTVLYGFFVLEPWAGFDGSAAIDIFLKYALVLAVLGIFQYSAQFAGLQISSLSRLMPQLKPFLIEDFFNSNAILEYGSNIVRSNGIFLVEPSTFSQLIVIAASIEIAVRRRFKFLPVYAAAYLTSFSGTGLLSLVAALAANSLFSFKEALRLPLMVLCGAMIFAVLAATVPEVTDRYAHRLLEFQNEKSSGYARYVVQGRAWSAMIDDGTILTGNGPGSFDRTYMIQGISSNPVLKLTHDYGLFTMLLGLGLLASTIWTRSTRFISLLFLSIFQLGEGSELNPCFLIPMIIVCVWGLKRLPVRNSRASVETIGFQPRMVLS